MGIDYEKFKRHCNMGVDVELENENGEKDTFTLKPLSIKQFVELSYFQDKDNQGSLTKEDTFILMDLFKDIIIKSYPELDDDTAESFALNNITDLMLILEQLAPRVDKRKMSQLQKMKELQNSKVLNTGNSDKTNKDTNSQA